MGGLRRVWVAAAAAVLLVGAASAQSSGASGSGGGRGGGSCAPLPAPPDAFFTSLTRMKADRSWTWNPWDSAPKVKDSATRFTCADFEFVHPGTIASPEQTRALALVRTRGPAVARRVVDSLAAWADGDLGRPARARAVVFVAYNPSPWDVEEDMPMDAWEALKAEAKAAADAGAAGHEFSDIDGRRALNHTFAWLATGQDKYADKAVAIIDAWSTTTRSFGPRYANGPLEAGWGLALFGRAAELLKSMGARAWTRPVERRFFAFVDTLLLPNLRFYDDPLAYTAGNEAGSNWAGSILEARLQYSVLREDVGAFEDAARRAVQWVGSYVQPDGTTDETLNRDFMHGQFGIAGLVGVASILYHQTRGALDLFEYRSPLQAGMALPPIAAALELHAAALLGGAPGPLAGAKLNAIRSPPSRNDVKDANYEAGLSHYTRVKKRALPNTAALLARSRPEALILHWGMGTLTHWGPDCIAAPSDACKQG